MSSLPHCILALGFLASTGVGLYSQEPRAKPPLGLNLAGVVDWSTDLVFVDAFRNARAWISQAKGQPWGKGGPLDLDELGNVRSLRPGQFAETVVLTDFGKSLPAGTFTCLFEGSGDLDFTGDARVVRREAGKLQVEIRPKNGSVFARITRTDPKDPVRSIRLIHPGHEATYAKEPFHPSFLKRWQGFTVFRFMDWARTNGSKLQRWEDRPTLRHHSQAFRGLAPELMIALCNTLQADPWFCMPHLADDDFVRQYARLVKKDLAPQRKVYLEYSNECWNGQFDQARWCREQGLKLGLSKNAYEAQLRFYSQRSVEMFRIWEEELGKDRLIRVLASQSANPWTGGVVVGWRDAFKKADAIAIAPYFGHRWGSPKTAAKVAAMKADELIAALSHDLDETRKHMDAYAALAKKHGLQLFAYEGGQHLAGYGGAENNKALTSLFHAANRHPGMKDLYLRNLKDWQEAGGGLFCVFSSLGRYSKWGSWGLLESHDQDPATAPKFQAILEYLGRR